MNNQTKFDIWWNSYPVKRVFGAIYSLGASIVILGAMFKILHLNGGGVMLAIGMTTEVIVFALGVFDKPFKEFDWERVFDFENNTKFQNQSNFINNANQSSLYSDQPEIENELSLNNRQNNQSVNTEMQVNLPSASSGLNLGVPLNDDDLVKLTESIQSLTTTAKQLSDLSSIAIATQNFVKNIETATNATKRYTQTQDSLNAEVEKLQSSYLSVSEGLSEVENNTKLYATKVEDINKNLASINSIYEIQLKNIYGQSETLNLQSESLQKVNENLNSVSTEINKIKTSATTAAEETENFRSGTTMLSSKINDLNKIYGNMLNALS